MKARKSKKTTRRAPGQSPTAIEKAAGSTPRTAPGPSCGGRTIKGATPAAEADPGRPARPDSATLEDAERFLKSHRKLFDRLAKL